MTQSGHKKKLTEKLIAINVQTRSVSSLTALKT